MQTSFRTALHLRAIRMSSDRRARRLDGFRTAGGRFWVPAFGLVALVVALAVWGAVWVVSGSVVAAAGSVAVTAAAAGATGFTDLRGHYTRLLVVALVLATLFVIIAPTMPPPAALTLAGALLCALAGILAGTVWALFRFRAARILARLTAYTHIAATQFWVRRSGLPTVALPSLAESFGRPPRICSRL